LPWAVALSLALLETLTVKERQIVGAVVAEKSARIRVIAEKLHMSEHTMRNHLSVIYEKLQVNGRMELYLFAVDPVNRCLEA
jgi:DNA-binding NarL/FixJ family response regulator